VLWRPSVEDCATHLTRISVALSHTYHGNCLRPAAIRSKLLPVLLEWDLMQQGAAIDEDEGVSEVSSRQRPSSLPLQSATGGSRLSADVELAGWAGRRVHPQRWSLAL